MVSLIPNYEKQRYVLNSDDDPGDIEFHNGDIVYLMDVRQEIIYSEEDNQWYPVPTGGGGGGEVHPYITYTEYEQAVDWSTDTNGNSLNFVNTYCNGANGLYYFGIKQPDNADQYAGVRGFYIKRTQSQNTSTWILRANDTWNSSMSNSASCHMFAGAVIGVWFIPQSTALEDLV